MPKSTSVELQARFLSALLQEREVQPRAVLLAQQIIEMFPGSAAVVYLLETDSNDNTTRWSSKAVAGEVHLDDEGVPLESGTLGLLARQNQPLLLSGTTLVREDYAHLHARRTLLSLAYIPMMADHAPSDQTLIGALEVATFDEELDQADLAALVEFIEYAAPAFSSAAHYEAERNSHLESISRLTQLYDVEKVFNSTLEMNELNPIITAKVRELLEAQAVNLWLVKDEHELLLMDRSGRRFYLRSRRGGKKRGRLYCRHLRFRRTLVDRRSGGRAPAAAKFGPRWRHFLGHRRPGCRQEISGGFDRSHQQERWNAVFRR